MTTQTPSNPAANTLTNILLILLGTAGLTIFFLIGTANLPLSEPDEARCALIARHMLDSGDWLAPYLVDRPYFDKPPLFFWMLACCMKAFPGVTWALRLAPALICAVTIVLTGVLATHLYNRRAGLFAAATFAVSFSALMAGRVIRMDMLLAMWVTAALLCWARAHLPSPQAPSDNPTPQPLQRQTAWPWHVAMYVCIALGCLTKGPVAILLPGLIVGLHMGMDALKAVPAIAGPAGARWSTVSRSFLTAASSLRLPLGAFIIMVIYGSWVAYMTYRYPQYLSEFFVKQNLDRFAGSGLDAVTGRFTVLASYLGGLMPWTILMALAAWQLRPRRGIPAPERFLWTWGLAVIIFFSLSKAQLPNYVLPAFPSTFALLGAYLAGCHQYPRQIRFGLIATFLLALVAVIAWPFIEAHLVDQVNLVQAICRIVILIVLAGGALFLWKRYTPQAAILPLLLAFALCTLQIAGEPTRRIADHRSSITLAEPLKTLDPSLGPVVIATVPLYGVIYYAPPAWQFRLINGQQAFAELPPLLDTGRDLYAVLTGGGLLDMLTGAGGITLELNGRPVNLRDRLTVLAQHDRDALVRIKAVTTPTPANPATNSQAPTP